MAQPSTRQLIRDSLEVLFKSGDVVEVRIVTDTYDIEEFFTRERQPVKRKEHSVCRVNRARKTEKRNTR